MPTAHELKNGPAINGTGARNRQATNPNTYARRDVGAVQAAHERAGQGGRREQHDRQDDEVASGERRGPEDRDRGRREPQLAPVIPGLGRDPREIGEPRRRECSSRCPSRRGRGRGPRRRPRRSILDWLHAVARARRHRRSVEERDRDDEYATGRERRGPRAGCVDQRDAARSGPSTSASTSAAEAGAGAGRRTTARTMAIAKPTATGVNELRPPDQIAAHQAARTISPDARPTPRVSPAGASDVEQTDRAGHPDPEQQADATEQQPLADGQPDRSIGDGDARARQEQAQPGHGRRSGRTNCVANRVQ